MEYNIGFGDCQRSGRIFFLKDKWKDWYHRWIEDTENSYYAYIQENRTKRYVGEVALRYHPEKRAYCIHVLIDFSQKGKFYGKYALKKLLQIAFEERNVDFVYDEFPASPTATENLFSHFGFRRISSDLVGYPKKNI